MSSNWSDSTRRESIIRKFTRWATGLDNPKHDGEILPLTDMVLRLASEGGRVVAPYTWSTGTSDPAEMVDNILEEVEFHANDYRKSGAIPSYVLHIHFGNRKQFTHEISLAPRPSDNVTGDHGSFPTTDLRDPKNQAATMVGLNVQQAMHKDNLFYGTMQGLFTKYSELYDKLDRSSDKKDLRIDSLEVRLDTVLKEKAEQEQRFKALEVDLEIKRANAQMIIGLKKIGAEALMPVLAAIGANIVKKTGGMMGVEELDIDDTMMKLADQIANDPKKLSTLMDGMDDNMKGQVLVSFQAIKQKAAQKRLTLTAQAGMEGVTKQLTVEKFTSIVKAANQQKAG